MQLSKNARMKLFQQTTGWSTDKMRANKKAVNDIVGCDYDDGGGGGGGSDINLETFIIDFDQFRSFSGETSVVPQEGIAWNEVIIRNHTQSIIPNDTLYDLAISGPAHEIYHIDIDGQTYYDNSDQGEGAFQPYSWYLLTSTEGECGMPECEFQIDLGEYGLLFKTGALGE